MIAVAIALHPLGAVVWVGGMFVIYVCLRPALGTLEPPQRMRLMRVTFQKFFPWVWVEFWQAPPRSWRALRDGRRICRSGPGFVG
jgi:uncharacterized membrane protein